MESLTEPNIKLCLFVTSSVAETVGSAKLCHIFDHIVLIVSLRPHMSPCLKSVPVVLNRSGYTRHKRLAPSAHLSFHGNL